MDTITHTCFGLALYGAVDKRDMSKKERRALLLTALAGSQIPDIDVISAWWDSAGRYQMWHRGLTHSVFMMPIWAALIAGCMGKLFGANVLRLFWLALIAVFIHSTSDLFNAWGTGYLEPFSQMRITFGTIPIVDFVFWIIMAGGVIYARYGRYRFPRHRIYRFVWGLILLHVAVQSAQGAVLYNEAAKHYDQVALSADFIPGKFTIIGKSGGELQISAGTVWGGTSPVTTLSSQENADLETLFQANPKARTLHEWAPFVVIVDDEERLGVFDPRFYRNGASFLYEYMEKSESHTSAAQ